MTCPFCEGFPSIAAERADEWLPLLPACETHRARALLRDGRPLLATLASFGHPVDGAGIAFLLNPVTIDGRRAWFFPSPNGTVVYGELFASADVFEFEAQHHPLDVAILHALDARRSLAAAGLRPLLLDWMASEADPDTLDRFERLAAAFVLRERFAPVLAQAAGAPPDALVSLAKRVEGSVSTPVSNDDTLRAVAALLGLASTRFAHLR